MNKAELASHVAAETSVPKAEADSVVNAVFAAIGEALARCEKVTIAGFGSFATRSRSARQGRYPRYVACNISRVELSRVPRRDAVPAVSTVFPSNSM